MGSLERVRKGDGCVVEGMREGESGGEMKSVCMVGMVKECNVYGCGKEGCGKGWNGLL